MISAKYKRNNTCTKIHTFSYTIYIKIININMALRIIFRKISTKSKQMLYLQLCSFHLSNCKSYINYIKYPIENYILNNNLNKRHLCSSVYNSDTEQNEDEDFEICHNPNQISIRSLLYPDSTDTLVLQLNECASVENVFNIIRENYNSFQSIHISQAILVLWDLQKIFYKHNIFYENDNNSSTILCTNAILKNYMDQVNAHEDFEKLMRLVEEKFKDFSLDALTCSLLYLNRMGVKLKTNTMQHMIARCEEEIKNCNVESFPLTALSRFIVTLFSQDSLWPNIISINSMPIILNRLDSCESAEDFKLLTICLNKMQQLVSNEHLHSYKVIAEKLIENDVIKNDNYRVIIKALRFLSQPQWHEYSTTTINKLMYLLKGRIDKLSSKELVILFKVFQMQKEPADMLEEIQKHASKLLQKMEGEIDSSVEIILDLLSCVVSFSSPLQRPRFEKLAKRYIENNLTPLSLSALYKILYHIKSSDTELCNMFWDRSLQCVQNDTPTDTLQNLISICHKYMHFSQDIGTRYRYYKFENTIIKMLLTELDINLLSYIPSKFARIASFVISYSNDIETVENTLQRLIDMSHRFNSSDCLIVSKGLQFASENIKFRKDNDVMKLLDSLVESLDKCTLQEMKQNNDLPNINVLLRGYIIRKGNMNEELFLKLMKHYDTNSEIFTSNIAKDLAFALQRNNCFAPELIDLLTIYVIKKKEAVLGNIAEKVLSLCYKHGYASKNNDEFLTIASNLIIRDKGRFSGLAFLQACLGLCYFHRLPELLVKHTFSVEFLEKLDEELSNCYAKMTYPTRVRDHLMQLNRAVCIDYPESNVPWFHQKYVDELEKQVPKKDVFQRKVFSTLFDIFGSTDTKIIEDSYSPYGYHLDFEIKHAGHAKEQTEHFSPLRIAVLLLKSGAFTNLNTNLKGYYQLRQRHLEMLGYKVIGVNYSEWITLCTRESCIAYLKSKM